MALYPAYYIGRHADFVPIAFFEGEKVTFLDLTSMFRFELSSLSITTMGDDWPRWRRKVLVVLP